MGQPVESRYLWIYENNPHGGAASWVAEDSTSAQVIACTSCFPRRLFVAETEVLGCVGGDTFVHPDWRQRGIDSKIRQLEDIRSTITLRVTD